MFRVRRSRMKKAVLLTVVVLLAFFLSSCPDYLGSDPAGRWNPIDPEYDEATDPDAETAPDPDGDPDDNVIDETVPVVTISRSDALDSATPVQSVTWNWIASMPGCSFRYSINTTAPENFGGFDSDFSNVSTATQDTGDGIYYIHVEARGADGITLSDVASASALLDNTAPNQVTDFTAAVGVELRYNIAGTAPATPADGTQAYSGTASSFPHENLASGTEYNYSIFAYDEAGNYSDPGTLTVYTENSATGPVTGFTATGSHQSVLLQWTNPGDAGFAGVMIRYSGTYPPPAATNQGTEIYNGTEIEYDHMYLPQSAATYYYAAFAYGTENNFAEGVTDSATTPDPVTLPSMAAEYLFNGNGGYDSSMSGNTLTLYHDPQETEDRFGATPGAYSFDGSTMYMEGPADDDSLDFPTDFAISVWFKPDDVATSTYQYILSKWSTGAGYELYFSENTFRVAVNQTQILAADITGMNGQFIHAVLVFENPGYRLYIQNTEEDFLI